MLTRNELEFAASDVISLLASSVITLNTVAEMLGRPGWDGKVDTLDGATVIYGVSETLRAAIDKLNDGIMALDKKSLES